jgi:MFS family permease
MATIAASKSTGTRRFIRENPTFRRLLGASSVSMLGSHVTTIAYPLLVLRLTGSPFTAGCAAFAATAPSVLVYIPAGALVDRWNPRRAMRLSELGRGLAIASVAVTLALGKPIVALLIAVAVIEGVLEVFSGLAERRYIGSFVEPDEVPSALVGMEARTHLVLVVGRPLGGLLFGIRPILPFLADVSSFIYSVATLTRITDIKSRGKSVPPRKLTPDGSLINEISQGLRWIRDDKFARMAMLSFSVGTLIFQALIMVFLGDAHDMHLPPLAIGLVLAASGVGGALGSAAASRLLPRIRYPWIRIQTLMWFAGFGFIALPIGRHFLCIAVVMAILGFTGALGNIALDTHLMQGVDKEMLARVTSVGCLVSFSACAIGPLLGGVLVQELGVPHAMSCLFLFTPVLLLLAARTPPPASRPSDSAAEETWASQPETSDPVGGAYGPFEIDDLEVRLPGAGAARQRWIRYPLSATVGDQRLTSAESPWRPLETVRARSRPGHRAVDLTGHPDPVAEGKGQGERERTGAL